MGSTITTGRVAAAVQADNGQKLFLLFEESYPSNVHPHTPSWDCMGLGGLPATMETIFDLATSCEGGMLRNRSGRLTPEGYIGTWLAELANPLVLRRTELQVSAGDGSRDTIHTSQLDEAADLLAEKDRPRHADELRNARSVTLDLAQDTDAVLALQDGLHINPWRLVGAHAVSHRDGQRSRDLGYAPRPGRTPALSIPAALRLTADVRLLQGPDGEWRCGGWQYALVGTHVRDLWPAELACPGHHRKRIAAYRNALEQAPPAPAGLAVEIDAAGTDNEYALRTIETLRRTTGAGTGVFRVGVTQETEYALTTLPAQCARWLLPDHAAAATPQQAALAV